MIKYIIIILILIIVLSFFGYDLKAVIESPLAQKNLNYTKSGVEYVWDGYLKGPLTYLYKNIFIGVLWKAFIHNLGRIDAGAPSELENAGQRFLRIGDEGYRPIDQ